MIDLTDYKLELYKIHQGESKECTVDNNNNRVSIDCNLVMYRYKQDIIYKCGFVYNVCIYATKELFIEMYALQPMHKKLYLEDIFNSERFDMKDELISLVNISSHLNEGSKIRTYYDQLLDSYLFKYD